MNARPFLALSLLALACSRDAQKPAVVQAADRAPASDAVAAVVDGSPITLAEVDAMAAGRLMAVRQQEYDIRRDVLDDLIGRKLMEREAAARKVSVEELRKQEVEAKASIPPPAEVERLYEQFKPRMGGQPKPDAMKNIETALRSRALEERERAFTRELRQKSQVSTRLDAPRVKVALATDDRVLGPADAPVTIVEYADYQCPYCLRAQDTVNALLDRYKGKVRFVHRDFPLDGHPRALPAARATRCAGEQGKFWDYHLALLRPGADFGDENLKKIATQVGVDVPRFSSCVVSDKHDQAIRKQAAEGEALGVSSTPTFFVNGRLISGARPIDDFASVIDAELQKGS